MWKLQAGVDGLVGARSFTGDPNGGYTPLSLSAIFKEFTRKYIVSD